MDIKKAIVDFFTPNNYGTTHAAITLAAMSPFILFDFAILAGLAGAATCGWWIYRELRGKGTLWNYPDDYQGIYSSWDRRMDWILPIITTVIALGIMIAF